MEKDKKAKKAAEKKNKRLSVVRSTALSTPAGLVLYINDKLSKRMKKKTCLLISKRVFKGLKNVQSFIFSTIKFILENIYFLLIKPNNVQKYI